MFKSHFIANVPVNLIKQPAEQAIFLVWLIAFAQFFNFSVMEGLTPDSNWILTAPALILSSVLMAIRTENSLPWLIAFVSGLIGVLYIINGDLFSILQGISSYPSIAENITSGLLIISVYTLFFWLLSHLFLHSRYFHRTQNWLKAENITPKLHFQFDTFIFYLTFLTLNSCVVFTLSYSDHYSLLSIFMAFVFLFLADKQFSKQIRGALIPVYITLALLTYLPATSYSNAFNFTFEIPLPILIIWSFILWLSHNYLSHHYNKMFPELQISTALWPWYGLLILVGNMLNLPYAALNNPSYLIIVIVYLFLMLRNTSSAIVSWPIILLSSWLFLITLPVAGITISTVKLSYVISSYDVYSLSVIVSLFLFNIGWERSINSFVSHFGWQKISFRKPVILVGFLASILWLAANILLAYGLISGWYNLIDEGILTENTIIYLIVTLFLFSTIMNNKLMANLIHISLILWLTILWALSKPVPLYMLFSMIHLIWVILPGLINKIWKRIPLPYPELFIKTANIWIYFSFLAAIISLIISIDSPNIGINSNTFMLSISILLTASMILAMRYSNKVWYVMAYLLSAGLIVSLRFVLLGTVPVNAYDTIGILSISFLLFILKRYGLLPSPVISSDNRSNNRSDNLVKWLPLISLFTVPWLSGSVHTSLTLLILGVFYLVIHNGNRMLQYFGFLCINVSMYLWVPLLSDYSNLLLFYILPISMSLLLISYLHQHEMQTGLANKIRFIALSFLYLVVAADIFMNDSLVIFTLGLLSALAGIIYGISSKTRAFLYTGVLFLVIIIFGQLILLYPDDRLGRALILMFSGAMITGIMIWFNIKREILLSRVQLIRTDLEYWD